MPIKNKVKGYVEYNGFGVITNVERIVQFNRKTNLGLKKIMCIMTSHGSSNYSWRKSFA